MLLSNVLIQAHRWLRNKRLNTPCRRQPLDAWDAARLPHQNGVGALLVREPCVMLAALSTLNFSKSELGTQIPGHKLGKDDGNPTMCKPPAQTERAAMMAHTYQNSVAVQPTRSDDPPTTIFYLPCQVLHITSLSLSFHRLQFSALGCLDLFGFCRSLALFRTIILG